MLGYNVDLRALWLKCRNPVNLGLYLEQCIETHSKVIYHFLHKLKTHAAYYFGPSTACFNSDMELAGCLKNYL